ncbi:putative adhesin [Peristeroidobacter soli]|uniref:putative adhesin n=1 Tax=Peristeroidobacter soli TaxID=2497877 RepID=UPI00101B9751|nr:hypothetical protein [Peristeroidobacter soli]
MPIHRVAVGANLYLFQSPNPNSNQCVILAHSGRKEDEGATAMPAGTSTHFYTADRSSTAGNVASSVALGREGRVVHETIRPGAGVSNYRLEKFHEQGGATYRKIKNEMARNTGAEWQPHVVTIRNRKLGAARTMQLSDVITEVQREHPGITQFHFSGCRGIIGEHED